MSATQEYVRFSIDGEWLANFARTRVMEGAWESALNMLVQDCSCTHEQAIKILKGHATFTGNSNDEDGLGWKELSPKGKIAKDMEEQLDFMYGTVFKYSEKYWKPYAYVQGWDQEDNKFACEYEGKVLTMGEIPRSKGHSQRGGLRSYYYANYPGRDLLVFIDSSPDKISDVLCEETSMPPLWYEVPINRLVEHLRALRDAGKLKIEHRGASSDTYLIDRKFKDMVEAVFDLEPRKELLAQDPAILTKQFLADLSAAKTVDEIKAIEKKYEGANEEAYSQSQALIEKLTGDRIRKQADEVGGWYELSLRSEELPNFDPSFLRIPKNAFLRWALRGFRFEDFGKIPPEWPCITSSGWKMAMDDPYHTDWLLGAGISICDSYKHDYDYRKAGEDQPKVTIGEAAMRAAYYVKSDIVKEWTGVEFSILARGEEDYISGPIVHAKPNQEVEAGSIAIVPNAGPEYYVTMVSACKENKNGRHGAIICETGGKIAHLSITGREQKCTVLMVPGALKKYREGDFLSIDLDSGKITLNLI